MRYYSTVDDKEYKICFNATKADKKIIYVNEDLDYIKNGIFYITVKAYALDSVLHHTSESSDPLKLTVTGERVVVSKADVTFDSEGLVFENDSKVYMEYENANTNPVDIEYNSKNYTYSLKTTNETSIYFETVREFVIEIIYKCNSEGMIGVTNDDDSSIYISTSTISEDIGTIKKVLLKPLSTDFIAGEYTISFTSEQEILEINIQPLSEVVESDYFYESIKLSEYKNNQIEANDPKISMAMTNEKWDEAQAKYSEFKQNVQQATTFDKVLELVNTFKSYLDSVK